MKPFATFLAFRQMLEHQAARDPAPFILSRRKTDDRRDLLGLAEIILRRLGQTFALGATVQAEIIRIDDQGRIRLSVRSPEERAQSRGPRGPRAEGERGEGRRRRDHGRGAGDFPSERGEDERHEAKAGPQGLGIMANAFKRVLGR